MEIYDVALAQAWAMRTDALENLLAIANRQHEVTPQALEAYRAQYADRGERLRIRDDVAILDVQGPLFKKANLLQEISGATSYAIMARDFQAALDDPQVRGIVLNIDSPGGMANGADELATAIAAARGKKPIIAYASGQAASAAYWIASAADKIVLSEGSEVGSIGVVMAIEDRSGADEKRGVKTVQFVSSSAPNKRPSYDTEDGRAVWQRRVDDLEAVFVASVARNRGVSEDTVRKDFGAGGVEIGANAVAKGMADEVGTFESAFVQLTARGNRGNSNRSFGGLRMSEKNGAAAADTAAFTQAELDSARAAARAEGVVEGKKLGSEAERTRVSAILDSADGNANTALARHFAFKTDMAADAAVEALKAAGPTAAAPKEPTAEEKAKAFYEGKAKGGTLGFAEPPQGASKAADDSWGAAVASTNRRIRA